MTAKIPSTIRVLALLMCVWPAGQMAHAQEYVIDSAPADNVMVRRVAWRITSARLGVAGTELSPDATGAYIVPSVTDHEVLILELQ